MSGVGLRRALAYQDERRAAATAHMDGAILMRMSKVRETLRERATQLDAPLAEMLVCVGPCADRGFYVGAISFTIARTIAGLMQIDLQPVAPGQVLVFTWNHGGYTALRTLPLGE